jgi:hypothetical protein
MPVYALRVNLAPGKNAWDQLCALIQRAGGDPQAVLFTYDETVPREHKTLLYKSPAAIAPVEVLNGRIALSPWEGEVPGALVQDLPDLLLRALEPNPKTAEPVGEKLQAYAQQKGASVLQAVSALDIVNEEISPPEQVLEDFVDVGDVVGIFGKSKQRKSWFAMQLALCIATGEPFLQWSVSRRHRVLLLQMEVQEKHYRRRIQRVAGTMFGGAPQFKRDLDFLRIVNCRGKNVNAEQIQQLVTVLDPEVVFIDPIYTLIAEESDQESVKSLVRSFAEIAESGRTVFYVHHDKKGKSGDVELVDRGSGSGVIGRAYDAACFLDAHKDSDDHSVVQSLCRNYAGSPKFSMTWTDFVFQVDDEMPAEVATSHSESSKRQRNPTMDSFVERARTLLPAQRMGREDAAILLHDKIPTGINQARKVVDRLCDPDFGPFRVETEKPSGRKVIVPVQIPSVLT